MTISVTWPTKVIFVPKADTVLIGTDPVTGREIRTYDTLTFWKQLRDLNDDPEGRAYPRPLDTNAPQTLGGSTYARSVIVINNYAVEFEDGTYRVILQGSNNNLADVAVINQVSIQPTNSAGLVEIASGSGLSVEQDARLSKIEDILEADEEYTETKAIKRHKDTKSILVDKDVTGGAVGTNIVISE